MTIVATFLILLTGVLFLATFDGLKIPKANELNQTTEYNLLLEGIKSLENCLQSSETIDPYLGPLPLKPELYCTLKTLRGLVPGVTCCHPRSPDSFGLKFWLHEPGVPGYSSIDFHDKRGKKKFKKTKDVVFLIPGFLENIKISPWMNGTKDGWNARGHPVIFVDWSKGNQLHYFQSVADLRSVGAAIGYAIIKWNIIDRAIVAGLSLGGQTVGEAGKYVREKTGRLIKQCHAFDPAGPFFDGGHDDMVLDKGDCKVVQVIHSSAGHSETLSGVEVGLMRLGTSKKSGHCDFWINCGHWQGEKCKDLQLSKLLNILVDQDREVLEYLAGSILICAHNRAAIVYKSAVTRKCSYDSFLCPNCGPHGDFCSAVGPRVNGLPPDSICGPSMDIDYFVPTDSEPEFCSPKENESLGSKFKLLK